MNNMCKLRGINLRVALCAIVLAFSTSCGDGDDGNTDGEANEGGSDTLGTSDPNNPSVGNPNWATLKHKVKASITEQVCVDGKPIESDLKVSFQDIDLPEDIDTSTFRRSNNYHRQVYCGNNQQNCNNASRISHTATGMPGIAFNNVQMGFRATLYAEFKHPDTDDNVLLTPEPIEVHFPNDVRCGDVGYAWLDKPSACNYASRTKLYNKCSSVS